jgi:hypothetical protein
MKLLGKTVDYFGLSLVVYESTKFLATTDAGEVLQSQFKPELDPYIGWLYDWEDYYVHVVTVDLEGTDWKDTLVEV